MSQAEPILFYDLVASPGAPFFSPCTTRARAAFALKRVPIKTVEVTYQDLIHTWTDKLGVEKATVPFILKPDGEYLMDSLKMFEWLEETYPDRPSIFLPEATIPVDRESAQYKAAALESEDFISFRKGMGPGSAAIFSLYGPEIWKTFDPATQQYWISPERMGEGAWDDVLSKNDEQSIQTVRETVATFAAKLSDTHLFFSSPTTPGIKDFWIMGPQRMLASTSAENLRKTFVEGGLGDWAKRMEHFLGEAWTEVLERDPK